mmetsp:Transcript_23110/g.39268  ORF Transcript_23110/g.39268 Transcript_23110/m.39268 type:complete len:423 (-) Transcript_23110:83-1351(-)
MGRIDLGHWSDLEGGDAAFRRRKPMTRLTWRSDPAESMSDWTIELYPKEEELKEQSPVQTFPVHKCVLATSSSEYFRRLFYNTSMIAETNVSRINLQESSRQAFPVLLDFIYSGEVLDGDSSGVTSSNAVALRHLARFFGIASLFAVVNEFIHSDMNPATAPKYYLREGSLYGDLQLVKAACAACAMNFDAMEEAAVQDLPPSFFHQIVTHSDFQGTSSLLSCRLGNYVQHQEDALAKSQLRDMVSSRVMPEVDPSVSCALLFHARPRIDSRAYKSLSERCVHAYSKNWETSFKGKHITTGSSYNILSDSVKIELLEASMESAQQDVRQIREANAFLEQEVECLRQQLTNVGGVQRDVQRARKAESALRGEVWRLRSELAGAKQIEAEAVRLQQKESFCFATGLDVLKPNLMKFSRQFLSNK